MSYLFDNHLYNLIQQRMYGFLTIKYWNLATHIY